MNEITKTQGTPEYLQQYQGQQAGQEDVNVAELKMPSILIAQGLSEVVKQGLVKYGMLYNSVTSETIGKEVTIIVSKVVHQWIYFPSDEEKEEAEKSGEKAVIKKSSDGVMWDDGTNITKDEKWQCEQYTFYCVMRERFQPIPFVINMRKTSRKAGKGFYQLIGANLNDGNNYPIFAHAYKLTTKTDQNKDKQEYEIFKVQPAGWAEQKEAELAAKIRENIEEYLAAYEDSLENQTDDETSSSSEPVQTGTGSGPATVTIEDEDEVMD